MGNVLTGRVIKVIDQCRLVINKGYDEGVTINNRFLIYHLDEELFDPDTKQSLGVLELVCGEGKPEHIQDHMTILVTAKRETRESKKVVKRNGYGFSSLLGGDGVTEETYDPTTFQVPFDNADTNCLFKQIR